jgi:hypothetical protein
MLLTEFVDETIVRVREVPAIGAARSVIGRGSDAEYRVAIANNACSRVQATLQRAGDVWLLVDGDGDRPSRNGIWYKGVRIAEPLIIEDGMSIDIFLGGADRVTLDNVQPQDAPTNGGIPIELAGEISALRTAIEQLQIRISAGDLKMDGIQEEIRELKANGEAIAEFRVDVDGRLDLLSGEILQALQTVQRKNEDQDHQLREHNLVIKRVCGALAAVMLGGAVFNATRSPDAAAQAINWVLGIGGVGGGAIAVGVDDRRKVAQ